MNSRQKGKVGERELGFPSLPQDGCPKSHLPLRGPRCLAVQGGKHE
jgi:hypothetical protein